MTRINLVPPSELTDQHLFSEFREIKMVPKALARSLKSGSNSQLLRRIPKDFTLNTGHVMFFYDKGKYLSDRFGLLCAELERRGVDYNRESVFDSEGTMSQAPWNGDYEPTPEALVIIRARIAEKVAMKPLWYRHTKLLT